MNQSAGGVHQADIGRVSVALAAFNLGISNMRRRKARTFLTCVTLVLLTFTVLSFTSVVQTIRFNEVPAPSDHGPRYNGIMIRTAMWDPLQEPAYRLLADEYGARLRRRAARLVLRHADGRAVVPDPAAAPTSPTMPRRWSASRPPKPS